MTQEQRRQRIIDFLICCELREVLELVERGSRNSAPVNLGRIIDRINSYSHGTYGAAEILGSVIEDIDNLKKACLDENITEGQLKFLIVQTYVDLN